MSKIILIRHAQASYGSDHYDQLSEKGIEQSKILGDFLVSKNIYFDKVFVGPLQRQMHTLTCVQDAYNFANKSFVNAEIKDGLKEHSGPNALKKALPRLLKEDEFVISKTKEIEKDPSLKRKNSLLIFEYYIDQWVMGKQPDAEFESWLDFRLSTRLAFNELLAQIGKNETIGIFTSGGTISSIVGEVLEISNQRKLAAMNYSIMNTSMTTLLKSSNKCNLLSLNEVPHLAKEMITFV